MKCCISSGSSLFVKEPFNVFPVYKGLEENVLSPRMYAIPINQILCLFVKN